MTTVFEIETNNIISTVTVSDCWATPGVVEVEEKMHGKYLYIVRIGDEAALQLCYQLLGEGWRVAAQEI